MFRSSVPARARPLLGVLALLCALLLAMASGTALAAGSGGTSSTTVTTVGTTAPTVTIPTTTLPAATSGTPAVGTQPPAHVNAKPGGKGGGVSTAAIVAAVLAALIALAALAWGVLRLGALEPHWLLSARHSLAEAGYRASATWAEFTDWIRLGH